MLEEQYPKRKPWYSQAYSKVSSWNEADVQNRRAEWLRGNTDQCFMYAAQIPTVVGPLFESLELLYLNYVELADDAIRSDFKSRFDVLRERVRRKMISYRLRESRGRGDQNKVDVALLTELKELYTLIIILRQKLGAGTPTKKTMGELDRLRSTLRGKPNQ